MKFSYTWVIIMSIFGVCAAMLSVFLMGAGHGYYEPAMLLFPWGMLGTVVQGVISPGLFPFW